MKSNSTDSSNSFWNRRFCSKQNRRQNPGTNKKGTMFRAIKRVFVWLGLVAEQATETDAINEAMVERGIRDAKAKADKAHYANGQLAGQIAMLKDQIKRQERTKADLEATLQACAAANDEVNGAAYAEQLAS